MELVAEDLRNKHIGRKFGLISAKITQLYTPGLLIARFEVEIGKGTENRYLVYCRFQGVKEVSHQRFLRPK